MSGSGKSTLLNLLPRNQDPSSGSISLADENGGTVDITALRLEDLRACAHVVPQESFLFSASIRDNLLLARPDASTDELDRGSGCGICR